MLRMEIALFLVLALVAYIYFSAERKSSPLLITALVHLVFDALTIYTVNHLDTVPRFLNYTLHRFFIGTMILILYLFYQYIAILVEEETGKPRRLDLAAKLYLCAAELGALLLPVHYAVTPQGNYSDGIHANVCYASVTVYLLLCAGTLLWQWKKDRRQEEIRHRRGAYNRTQCVGSSGAAPHMAHQRHGHHADDACLLSHA